MCKRVSYEELATVLARHIYKYWREQDSGLVDDMCTSQHQIPVGVLTKLNIMEHITVRHSEFRCEPEDFRNAILSNKEKGCSYDTVVLAVILTVEHGMGYNVDDGDLIDQLEKLGVCEHQDCDRHVAISRRKNRAPQARYVWTDKREFYDNLYGDDWPSLIK